MSSFLKKRQTLNIIPPAPAPTDSDVPSHSTTAIKSLTASKLSSPSLLQLPSQPPQLILPTLSTPKPRFDPSLLPFTNPSINRNHYIKTPTKSITTPKDNKSISEHQNTIESPIEAKIGSVFFKPEFAQGRKRSILQDQQQQIGYNSSTSSTKITSKSISQTLTPLLKQPSSGNFLEPRQYTSFSTSMLNPPNQPVVPATVIEETKAQGTVATATENTLQPNFRQAKSSRSFVLPDKLNSRNDLLIGAHTSKTQKLLPFSSKARASIKFHTEVQSLLDIISPPKTQAKKTFIAAAKKLSIISCFSSLVNLGFTKPEEEVDPNKIYQQFSVLTIRKARALMSMHPQFFENGAGTGLIIIQSSKGCSIIPCLDHKINETSCYVHPIGSRFLVREMREMLEYELQGAELRESEMNIICKEIIIKHCYFAKNFASEKADFLRSYLRWVVYKKPLDQIKDATKLFFDYTLSMQLGYQQIACTELIFKPKISLKHKDLPSLMDLISSSLTQFTQQERVRLLKNIVCSGIYPQLPGFPERLTNDIMKIFPDCQIPKIHITQNLDKKSN